MYVVNKMRGNLQIEASSSWVSVVVEGCSGVDDEIGTHDEWYMGKKAHYIILWWDDVQIENVKMGDPSEEE